MSRTILFTSRELLGFPGMGLKQVYFFIAHEPGRFYGTAWVSGSFGPSANKMKDRLHVDLSEPVQALELCDPKSLRYWLENELRNLITRKAKEAAEAEIVTKKIECPDCEEGKIYRESWAGPRALEPKWKTLECQECEGTGFQEIEVTETN